MPRPGWVRRKTSHLFVAHFDSLMLVLMSPGQKFFHLPKLQKRTQLSCISRNEDRSSIIQVRSFLVWRWKLILEWEETTEKFKKKKTTSPICHTQFLLLAPHFFPSHFLYSYPSIIYLRYICLEGNLLCFFLCYHNHDFDIRTENSKRKTWPASTALHQPTLDTKRQRERKGKSI